MVAKRFVWRIAIGLMIFIVVFKTMVCRPPLFGSTIPSDGEYVELYKDGSGTNSIFTFHNGRLNGQCIRYERTDYAGHQDVFCMGTFSNGVPWNGKFIRRETHPYQTSTNSYWNDLCSSLLDINVYSNGVLLYVDWSNPNMSGPW